MAHTFMYPHIERPTLSTAACLVAIVASLSACKQAAAPVAEEIRPVRIITVEKLAGGDIVSLSGTVQAQTEVNLSFRVDGRLVDRNVKVGDAIKSGQTVATLNPENEQSGVIAAQATLSAARGQLVEARNDFNRQRELLAQNFISKARFDQVAANLQTAEAQVQSAQAQLNIAQNRLGYTRLVADAAGTVTAVGAEPGEVVQAGRMIVQVARKDGRDAVFGVPPRIKDSAPPNPEITVSLTGDPQVTAVGRVREVSPRADPATGTFQVRVGLTNTPAAMRLGSTVTGRMPVGGESGIEIPPSAVTRSDRQTAVWVVDPKTKTVSLRTVDIVRNDPARVLVGSGLATGDIVVIAGVQALRPGQKVRLLGVAP